MALSLIATPLAAEPTRGAPKPDMEALCTQEVIDLHQFFQDWFQGVLPKTDHAFARFAGVMDPAFHIVTPSGRKISIDTLGPGLRQAHGTWTRDSDEGQGSRIWIKNTEVRPLTEELALVTYEEWQTRTGTTKGRLSTAILQRDPEAPNGVRWLHVHETWLPERNEASAKAQRSVADGAAP